MLLRLLLLPLLLLRWLLMAFLETRTRGSWLQPTLLFLRQCP